MARLRTPENAEKVAFLLARGFRPAEIRQTLGGWSESIISRLKADALASGLLMWQHNLPERRRRELEQLFFPDAYRERLVAALGAGAERLQEVVVPKPRFQEEPEQAMARTAAQWLVSTAFPASRLIGITWGRVLHLAAQGVEKALVDAPPSGLPALFVPVCGDSPQVARNPEVSSSVIAAVLDRSLRKVHSHDYSLAGVSSRFPEDFGSDEVATARKLFAASSSYAQIFGTQSRPGLAAQLDCLLTGVGTLEDSYNVLSTPGLLKEKDTPGNIGGVFLHYRDATFATKERVQRVNERWTGLCLKHITLCAARASTQTDAARGIGVVVLAMGSRKAPVIRECLRQGLINNLVIDGELAGALASM